VPREDHRAIPCAVYSKRGPTPQTLVTVMLPHPTEQAPAVQAELLAQTPEMLAVRIVREVGEETVLYSFDGPRTMEAAGIATNGRLAVVRGALDGALAGGVVAGTELTVDGVPVPMP
jgi:hypothetical protein